MSATPTSGRLPKDSDVCSVCLSPFQSFFVEETKDFDENNLPIVTKCKHHFHPECLQRAKCVKLECPLCRCRLSPDPADINMNMAILAQKIVHASTRGRNAVRLRLFGAVDPAF